MKFVWYLKLRIAVKVKFTTQVIATVNMTSVLHMCMFLLYNVDILINWFFFSPSVSPLPNKRKKMLFYKYPSVILCFPHNFTCYIQIANYLVVIIYFCVINKKKANYISDYLCYKYKFIFIKIDFASILIFSKVNPWYLTFYDEKIYILSKWYHWCIIYSIYCLCYKR